MQKYILNEPEISFEYIYSINDKEFLSQIKSFTNIVFDKHQIDVEKAKIITLYVYNRFKHDGYNIPDVLDVVSILKKVDYSLRCVEYSHVLVSLLLSYGIQARVVGLKTKDIDKAEKGAGHVVIEFWSKELRKWIMVDPQVGFLLKCQDLYLSTFELFKCLDKKLQVSFEFVGIDIISSQDFLKYIEWIKIYLYFFDIPLFFDPSQKISENERLSQKKLMLIPLGVEPPKYFQGNIINAVYTHSIIDFYSFPKINTKEKPPF